MFLKNNKTGDYVQIEGRKDLTQAEVEEFSNSVSDDEAAQFSLSATDPGASAPVAKPSVDVVGHIQSAQNENPVQRDARIADWKGEALNTLKGLYKGNFNDLQQAVINNRKMSDKTPDESKYLYSMVKAVMNSPDEATLNQNLDVMKGRNPFLSKVVDAVTRKTWNRQYGQDVAMPTVADAVDAAKGAVTGDSTDVSPVLNQARDAMVSKARSVGNTVQGTLFPNLTLRQQDPNSGTASRMLGAAQDVFGAPARLLTAGAETAAGNGDISFAQNFGRPDAYSNAGERLADFTIGSIVPGAATKFVGGKLINVAANTNVGRSIGSAMMGSGSKVLEGVSRAVFPGETAHFAVLGEQAMNPALKYSAISDAAEGLTKGLGEGVAYSAEPTAFLATSPRESNPNATSEAVAQGVMGPLFGAGLGAVGGLVSHGVAAMGSSPEALMTKYASERAGKQMVQGRLRAATANEPLSGSNADVQLFQDVVQPALEAGVNKTGAARDQAMSVIQKGSGRGGAFTSPSIIDALGGKTSRVGTGPAETQFAGNDLPGYTKLDVANREAYYNKQMKGVLSKLKEVGESTTMDASGKKVTFTESPIGDALQKQISYIGDLYSRTSNPDAKQAYGALYGDLKSVMQSEAKKVTGNAVNAASSAIQGAAKLGGAKADIPEVVAQELDRYDQTLAPGKEADAQKILDNLQSSLEASGIKFPAGMETSDQLNLMESLKDPAQVDAMHAGVASQAWDKATEAKQKIMSSQNLEKATADFKKIYDLRDALPEQGKEEAVFRQAARARLDPFTRESELKTKVIKPLIDLVGKPAVKDKAGKIIEPEQIGLLNDPATGVDKRTFLTQVLKDKGSKLDETLVKRLKASIARSDKWELKDVDYLTPAVTRELRGHAPQEGAGKGMYDAAGNYLANNAYRYGTEGLVYRVAAPLAIGAVKGTLGATLGASRSGVGAPYAPGAAGQLFGSPKMAPFDTAQGDAKTMPFTGSAPAVQDSLFGPKQTVTPLKPKPKGKK